MLRYVGDGSQVPGVPPRDLSDAEAAVFGSVLGEVDGARVAAGLRPLYEVTADRRPLTEEAFQIAAPRRKGKERTARSFDSAGQTAASSAQDDSAGVGDHEDKGDHEGSPLRDEEGE